MRSNSTARSLIATPALPLLLAALTSLSACASAPPPAPTPAPAPPTPNLEASGVLFFGGSGAMDANRDGWRLIKDGVKPLKVDVSQIPALLPDLVGERVTIAAKTRTGDAPLVLSMTADAKHDGVRVEGVLRAHPAPEDPQSEAPRWFLALDDGRTIDAVIDGAVVEERVAASANTRVSVRAGYGSHTAFKADNWTGLTITRLSTTEAPKNHRDLEGVFLQQEDGWVLVGDSLEATPIDVTAIHAQLGVTPPKKEAKRESVGLKGKSVLLKGATAESEGDGEEKEGGPGQQRFGVLARVSKDGSLVAVAAHALREPGRSEGVRVEGTVKRVWGKWKVVADDGLTIDLDITKIRDNVWSLRGKPLRVTGAPVLSGEAPTIRVEEVAFVDAG